MAWPAGITTRTVNFGPAVSFENGDGLTIELRVNASRRLVWAATGTPLIPEGVNVVGNQVEAVLELPVTDQAGYVDGKGGAIDVTGGAHSHYYTATITYKRGNQRISTLNVDPFAVPAGDGSPIDLDLLLPVTTGGATVQVPDTWSATLDETKALAAGMVWQPSTAYAAGDVTQAPDGTTIRRLAAGTSGTAFDATEEAAWESVAAADGTLLKRDLTATFVAGRSVAFAPAPLYGDLALTAPGVGEPIPLAVIDGVLYGNSGTTLSKSTDGGATWTVVASTFPAGARRLLPTTDGEVIVTTSTTVQKSTGWTTDPATATYATKITAYSDSTFLYSHIDGDGQKFIACEYNASTFANSRYVHVSTDAGTTWTVAWDASVEFPAETASHLHGPCYDPWEDRFWFPYAHSGSFGMYYSDDNGATWTRLTGGLADQSALPFVMCATDDGIVCGGDASAPGGLLGIRRAAPADLALESTWAWRFSSQNSSGQADTAFRDPATGLVYVGFKSLADTPPIIAAGTATTGGLVWSLAGGVQSDAIWNLMVDGDGNLAAHGNDTGGTSATKVLYAKTGRVGVPVNDTGGALGGDAAEPSSVSVGADSTAAGRASVAVGTGASSGVLESLAVGHKATANAGTQGPVALGPHSVASNTYALAVGHAATASNQNAVAFGRLAVASATNSIAMGTQAQAGGASGTALGVSSNASGVQAVAVGASAVATHTQSVALGQGTTTTQNSQVQIGGRHIALAELAADPPAPNVNQAHIYVKDDGAGNTILCVRTQGGVKTVTMA